MSDKPVFYVASRASLPERPAMWQMHAQHTADIISSWIWEAGNGETEDFGELWTRIRREIITCDALVLYVEPDDFPLKGALIEVGMALALGKPVRIVAPGVELQGRTFRPLGSWIKHSKVKFFDTVDAAFAAPVFA